MTDFRGYSFRANAIDYGNRVELLLSKEDGNGNLSYVKSPMFEAVIQRDDEYIAEPTLRFSRDVARSLMDALWYAGVRPTIDSAGESTALASTKYHLEDMRKLVFKDGS
jgi:hypothetical protein